MVASDIAETAENPGVRRRIDRYDLVLAVIPAAFLFAGLVERFASVPTYLVVATATIVGVLALVDGLFLNPPQSGSGTA